MREFSVPPLVNVPRKPTSPTWCCGRPPRPRTRPCFRGSMPPDSGRIFLPRISSPTCASWPRASWQAAWQQATASASCPAPATSGRWWTLRCGLRAASPSPSTKPPPPARLPGTWATRVPSRRSASRRTTRTSSGRPPHRKGFRRWPTSGSLRAPGWTSSAQPGPPSATRSSKPAGALLRWPTSRRSSTPPAPPDGPRAAS